MNQFVLSAADAATGLSWWDRLLQPQIFVFLVPIVAIVGGITVAIIKSVIRHRERMAMIEHGMNPDAEKPE